MANRVQVASNKPNKKKNRFFTKPQSNFKSHSNRNFKFTKTNLKKKFVNGNNEVLKEIASSSDSFFINPSNIENRVFEAKRCKNNASKVEKKPFDKKKYRLQKYSKKYKLQQWEENRKKAVLRNYYRHIDDDEPKLNIKKIYKEAETDSGDNLDDIFAEKHENNLNPNVDTTSSSEDCNFEKKQFAPINSKAKKNTAFKNALNAFQVLTEEKKKKREEYMKKRAERAEALQEYKNKKLEKYKILNRKTKKGQPIMKDRIELLLKKIQDSLQ